MTRRDEERLDDIDVALAAIDSHLRRGDISDGLIFDAVRVRLIEIGEAVKQITPELLETEPDVPWHSVAGMIVSLITTSTRRTQFCIAR
jgi:uncharacterized protein with HEPN domain